MLDLNPTTLTQVVNSAKLSAASEPRWLNAIDKAAAQLLDNPYIARQDGHLLIASPSGEIYSSTGVCQCQAYQNGRPCWHRAAARPADAPRRGQQRQQARPSYAKAMDAIGELFA
jgi:hypothetical protein